MLTFRKQLEQSKQVLYRPFTDSPSFIKEIDTHLRAYAKGELPNAAQQHNTVILPLAALAEVQKAKDAVIQKEHEVKNARNAEDQAMLQAQKWELTIAEDAATLSKQGKVEFAREKFTQLLVSTNNLDVLFLAYEFFYRTGDIDSAKQAIDTCLLLCQTDDNPLAKAKA